MIKPAILGVNPPFSSAPLPQPLASQLISAQPTKDEFLKAVSASTPLLFAGDQSLTGKRVVYAGSFDPPTNGHLWMIEEAARMFENVTVIMAVNPDKKYTFSDAERLAMIKDLTKDMPNVDVDILNDRQFLVKKAKDLGAVGMIRGMRSVTDFEYEWNLTNLNRKADDSIQTIALFTPKHLGEVSSSTVKGLTNLIGWRDMVHDMVPDSVFHSMKLKTLENRFAKLTERLSVQDKSMMNKVFQSVITGYDRPERTYHNVDHLLDVLEQYDEYLIENPDKQPKHPQLFELALWFHDMVDDRQNGMAVKENADTAIAFLNQIGASQGDKNYVKHLILATDYATHKAIKTTNSFDLNLLNDIDLSILGKTPEKYHRYVQQIKEEYVELVKKTDFKKGRVAILSSLLEREPLYKTPYFYNLYEAQARKNIQSEITNLGG